MRFNKELGEMTRIETAKYLGIAPLTLDKWNIPHFQMGRIVMYRKSDIEKWKDEQIGRTDGTGTEETTETVIK